MSSTRQHAEPGGSAPPQDKGKRPLIRAPRVFFPVLTIVVAAVAVAFVWSDGAAEVVEAVTENVVVAGLGPWFLVAVAGFVLFSLVMGLSRFGDIKLGKDDDEPEFSLLSWFAMLFAAGMGIGLVFWGAAEPLHYFTSPRPGVGGDTADFAQEAMNQVFLHWGFHAWAIYAVVGLSLAYAIHRKGRPVSIRWTLEPLLGNRVKGWLGDVIDIIAVVGTIFGVATSLGLGVSQISAGLNYLGLIPEAQVAEDGSLSDVVLIVLITVISLIALVSVVSGVGKGIKWLSNINLGMAGVFMIALLLLGPTLYLLRVLVESFGGYLAAVVPLTFDAAAYTGEEGQTFQRWWTIFYWGWWISWAPFVGVFIARISKGRTVRQFIAGVLLVPTLISFVWFTVMGAGAIREAWQYGGVFLQEDPEIGSALWDPNHPAGPTVDVQPENVLFNYLDGFPAAGLLAVIATVMVALFFITSSDSGSLVVDMLASGGDIDPPKWSRAMWAALEGVVAITLLLAGGLTLLRDAAILTAVPVVFVMAGMCVSLYRALNAEHQVLVRAERRARREELERQLANQMEAHLEAHVEEHVGETFDKEFPRRFRKALADVPGFRGKPAPGAAPVPEAEPDETSAGRFRFRRKR